jgi:16S rRNA (uracil1498-N3)-methyltransferase
MELFFEPDIEKTLTLNEQESRHCISVLRHKAGDEINVADGAGSYFRCVISKPHPKRCEVEIVSKDTFDKRNFGIHIAIAPTKNIDRTEWFIEKVTEIGVEMITLLKCEHSERKKVRADRLEKIVVSASKQSVKAYKPVLTDLIPFKEFVQKEGKGFIAHCNSDGLPHLKKLYQPGTNALLLIGPEGDFSPSEVEYAIENGFKEVSLGNSRLRTETAGIVGCTILNMLND